VQVLLGDRVQTVHVEERADELELTSTVPGPPDAAELVRMLEENRRTSLAWWRVSGGTAEAVSRCPVWADDELLAHHLRDTAALADRYELRTSEIDT
jgi:hypothetical protein